MFIDPISIKPLKMESEVIMIVFKLILEAYFYKSCISNLFRS